MTIGEGLLQQSPLSQMGKRFENQMGKYNVYIPIYKIHSKQE